MKYTERIEVRFTATERSIIERRAKESNITVSEWIRRRCVADSRQAISPVQIKPAPLAK